MADLSHTLHAQMDPYLQVYLHDVRQEMEFAEEANETIWKARDGDLTDQS